MAEMMWLSYLFDILKIKLPSPHLFCDNRSAICVTKNSIFHKHMKYVGTDCHVVREQVVSDKITVSFVPSANQLADLLTKTLPTPPYITLISKLALVSQRSS